jgi:hypothetical protein
VFSKKGGDAKNTDSMGIFGRVLVGTENRFWENGRVFGGNIPVFGGIRFVFGRRTLCTKETIKDAVQR